MTAYPKSENEIDFRVAEPDRQNRVDNLYIKNPNLQALLGGKVLAK